MKQVPIDALLETPRDGVTYQREWTVHGEQGWKALYLEIALFCGAVGPGLFLIAAALGSPLGLVVGYLVVAAGYGLPHLLFLGRIERFWRGMLRPGTSWISRGFLFANAFLLFGLLPAVHAVPWLDARLPAFGSQVHGAILLIACAAALLLAIYPGFLLATLRAIPFWHSAILAPLFLTQGLGGGVASAILLSPADAIAQQFWRELALVDLGMAVLAAVLIGLHLSFRSRSGAAGNDSVEQLLQGGYRRLFLGGAVLAGLACPLALLGLALVLGAVWPALAAGVLQLTGILLFKYCLLNVGGYRPLLDRRLIAGQPLVIPRESEPNRSTVDAQSTGTAHGE